MPEAMTNFLALLGWSPGATDQELFSRTGLVESFDLGGISGGNAVFNPEKLDWFNQQHIQRLAPDEVARRVQPALVSAGLWDDALVGDRHAWFFAVLELLKPRVKKLDDIVEVGRFFFVDVPEYRCRGCRQAPPSRGHRRASARARRRIRRARDLRFRLDRSRAPYGGRCYWCESRYIDSRRACGSNRPYGESGPVRGALAARP